MIINLNESRNVEKLYKCRDKQEKRENLNSTVKQQQHDEQNQSGFQGQLHGQYRLKSQTISQNQTNQSENMAFQNTQNSQYQGDLKQNEGLFKDYHQMYENYENYKNTPVKVKSKSLHNTYQNAQNNQTSYLQVSISDVEKNQVEQKIQEKINFNIGNFFSEDKIKLRLAEMELRNLSSKQSSQNTQNIQMRNNQETVNPTQSNKQQLFKNYSQPQLEKYINPINQQNHQVQLQEKNSILAQQILNQNQEKSNIIIQQTQVDKKRAQSSHLYGKYEIKHQKIEPIQQMKVEARGEKIQQQEQDSEKKRSSSYVQRKTESQQIQQNKPPINHQAFEIKKNINVESDKLKLNRQEQWERILRDKIDNLALRDNQKFRLQQKEQHEKYHFVPQINEISKQIVMDKENEFNVEDIIYQGGMMKQQQIKELKSKYENSQPNIIKPDVQESIYALKGNGSISKSLYERQDDVIKDIQKGFQQLQMKNENESNHSYKPHINQNSEILVQQDSENGVQKITNSVHGKEQRRLNMCNFQPSIHPLNKDDIHDEQYNQFSQKQKKPEEFVQKQHRVTDHLKQKLVQQIKDTYKKSEFTFKPQTNQVSKYLIAAADETKDVTNFKLHEYDYLKRMIVQQNQQSNSDSLQFKSEMNPHSRIITRQVSVDSLTKNKNERINKTKEIVEKEKMKELSYSSATNKNRMHSSSKERIYQPVYDQKQNRETQIIQIEKKEVKDYSLNPDRKQLSSVNYKDKLKKINGVDKYLQRKEQVQQQNEQNKQKQENVYKVRDLLSQRETNNTIAQPIIQLKKQDTQPKGQRKERKKEFTFNPKKVEQQKLNNLETTEDTIPSDNFIQFDYIPEDEEINNQQNNNDQNDNQNIEEQSNHLSQLNNDNSSRRNSIQPFEEEEQQQQYSPNNSKYQLRINLNDIQ